MSKKWITGEYIELCKDKELQRLAGNKSNEIHIFSGDQLDEEIAKRMKEEWSYRTHYIKDTDNRSIWSSELWEWGNAVNYYYFETSTNPLITKIKILKELLEAE